MPGVRDKIARRTSPTYQDELYGKLVKAAEDKRVTIWSSQRCEELYEPARSGRSRTSVERLSKFWNEEIFSEKKGEFPVIANLYLRYKDNPQKQSEFETLDKIIRDPAMMPFWEKTLKHYGISRYRFKGQPNDQPDLIHPFELIAGEYYYHHILSRWALIDTFTNSRISIAKGDFSEVVTEFISSIEAFKARTIEDSEAKKKLLAQKKELQRIKSELPEIERKLNSEIPLNSREGEIFRQAQSIFEELKTIMNEEILKYQHRDIKAGLQFKSFFAFWCEVTLKDRMLECMEAENTLIEAEAPEVKDPSPERVFATEEDAFTPTTLRTMKEIDECFDQYRDLFIYPSYLLGAHLNNNRAMTYLKIVDELLQMYNHLKQTQINGSNMEGMLECAKTLYYYLGKAKTLQTNALNYAVAAAKLEKTGIFPTNLDSGHLKRLLFLPSKQCETLDEFANQLAIDITESWDSSVKAIQEVTHNGTAQIPAPTSCQQEVEKILRRHTVGASEETTDQKSLFAFA